jgi:hypothetical protein
MLINKADTIQRTTIQGIKTNIKPWEIFNPTKTEEDFLLRNYGNLFWKIEIKNNEVDNEIKNNKKKKWI